jgi:hypothetical protein
VRLEHGEDFVRHMRVAAEEPCACLGEDARDQGRSRLSCWRACLKVEATEGAAVRRR